MIFSNLLYRLRWFNTPAGILMLLLQRTPVLRMMVSESPGFGLQSGEVLKSAFALVALGAYNSVAGATVFNATAVSPATVTPASGGANTTFTSTIANNSAFSLAFNGTGAPSTIRSWKVTGTLPAGISVTGGTAITGGFVFNGLKVTLSGTPTVSGSQTLSIRAYDSLNASGNNAGITCIVSVTGGVTQVAPAFTTQPATQTVTAGGNVTFSASASGVPTPTLQWYLGTNALTGKTTGTLTLTNVQAVNAGSYTVVATNSAAPSGVSSTAATLTVNPAPVAPAFTTQPATQTVTAGTNVTFSAAASGTPTPTLQWFRADLLSSGSTATILLAGETRNTLVIANVQASDSGSYFFAVATNSAAPSGVSSTAATLTVGSVSTVPGFTTQPRSQSVILGSNVSFTVVATGTPAPTYQWFKDDVLMPGKTSATLVFTDVQLSDQGYFRVMIYNDATPAGSPSRRVLLQVMTPLEVWRQVNLGTRANTGSAADNADPDGDGVSNLLEYALGGNPGSASSAPSPQISTVRNGNSDYLTLSLTPAVSDVIYQVEVSADLTTWTSTMLTGLTIGQTYTYTDTVAVNTGPHRYLRLRVTSP